MGRRRPRGRPLACLRVRCTWCRQRVASVQLLRYVVRVWERDDREGIRNPKPVIPIILYHGRTPWKAPTRHSDVFSGPDELRAYWPELQVALVDLTAIPEAAIVGHVWLRVALLVMQAIHRRDLAGESLDEVRRLIE